jgi:hypothetical protein
LRQKFDPLAYLFCVILSITTTACQTLPTYQSQTGSDKPSIPVIQTSDTLLAEGPRRQMLTMPSLVKTQTMSIPSSGESQALSPLFNLSSAQGISPQPGTHLVTFHSRPTHPQHQIKMPVTGGFRLVLVAGPQAKMLDGDATDGEACLQLPQGTWDTLLYLPNTWGSQSRLRVQDRFYYVDEQVSSPLQANTLRLGTRPLPVPQDWHSPDGNTFVLNFNAQQISHFQLLWRIRSEQAAFPPGVAQLGPEGGILELPGVARLEMPPGALNESTIVRMSQLLNAPDRSIICHPDGDECNSGVDFASAIVQLQPRGLKLAKVAKLDIPTNKSRLGNNHPSVIMYSATATLEPDDWSYEPFMGFFEDQLVDDLSLVSDDVPFAVLQFAYFTKFIGAHIKPTSNARPFKPIPGNKPYSINQKSITQQNFHTRVIDPDHNSSDELKRCFDNGLINLRMVDNYLNNAYLYFFEKLNMEIPNASFPHPVNRRAVILVEVSPDASIEFAKVESRSSKASGGVYMAIFACKMTSPQRVVETVIHETFHTFQYAFSKYTKDFISNEDKWFIESSATFMEAYLTSKFLQDYGLSEYDPELSTYVGWIQNSQKNLDVTLPLRWPRQLPGPYSGVGFISHILLGNKILCSTSHRPCTPTQALADLTKEYNRLMRDSNAGVNGPRSTQAFNALIMKKNGYKDPFAFGYEGYAHHALSQEILSVLQFPFSKPHYIPGFKDNITYLESVNFGEEVTVGSAYTEQKPLAFTVQIPNLASKYIPIKAGPDVTSIAIRLRVAENGQDPVLTPLTYSKGERTQDYLHAHGILLHKEKQNSKEVWRPVPSATFQPVSTLATDFRQPQAQTSELLAVGLVLANSYWKDYRPLNPGAGAQERFESAIHVTATVEVFARTPSKCPPASLCVTLPIHSSQSSI